MEDDSTQLGHHPFSDDNILILRLTSRGYGGKDLWYVEAEDRSSKVPHPKTWAHINTAGDDMFPTSGTTVICTGRPTDEMVWEGWTSGRPRA